MLGLVSYSSDEEDGTHSVQDVKETVSSAELSATTATKTANPLSHEQAAPSPLPRVIGTTIPPDNSDTTLGPLSGPAGPPTNAAALPSTSAPSSPTSPPGSPYTTTRHTIHSLTLPSHPNTSIPPSPPGSPRASTTAKLRKFLTLKSSGVHFNAKLAASPALANPELLTGLMEFAGVGQGYDQYASVLSEEVAVVRKPVGREEAAWPKEAYVEELNRSQEKIARRKEEERKAGKREGGVGFVKAQAVDADGAGKSGNRDVKRRRER